MSIRRTWSFHRAAVAAAALFVAVLAAVGATAWPRHPASPPSADAVVASALKTARAEHKIVLIEFGASWCVWCRRFQAFVSAPETSRIVHANYVVTNLTVQERDDKKALENAGGQARLDEWGGAQSGLPFYVFLDEQGRKIADSNAMPDGKNIGFPAAPDEVDRFMMLLEKTAPRMSPAERTAVLGYLRRTSAEISSQPS